MKRSQSSSVPRLSVRTRTFLALALGLVITSAALAYALKTLHTASPRASSIGGPFKLMASDGRVLADADMRGGPFLVYFGYTHCPDICPATLAEISDVFAEMPGKPIKALFITVDPERDTQAVMKDYLSNFDQRMIGLTGDRSAIDRIEHAYRVYARKAPQPDGDYTMDHSSIVYLMDSTGRFVEAFNLDRKPEESARELEIFL